MTDHSHTARRDTGEGSISLTSVVAICTGVIIGAGIFAAFTRCASFISVVRNSLRLRSAKI